jgi:hypothetical protein
MPDDYDLMPHRQINELKALVQNLKNKIDTASPKELIDSMYALTRSIDSMMNLFRQAADEMKYEEKEEILSGGSEHKAINEKLDKVIEQNKIIADGMLAISDMVKDTTRKAKIPQHPPQPHFQPSMRAPSFPPPKFEPSFNSAPPQPPTPGPMPEPPLPGLGEESKKKGLFRMFKN